MGLYWWKKYQNWFSSFLKTMHYNLTNFSYNSINYVTVVIKYILIPPVLFVFVYQEHKPGYHSTDRTDSNTKIQWIRRPSLKYWYEVIIILVLDTYHCLVNGIWSFIRKYTCRQAGHYFLYIVFVTSIQHIVIYCHVIPLKNQNRFHKSIVVKKL